jgi:hypothetical protein
MVYKLRQTHIKLEQHMSAINVIINSAWSCHSLTDFLMFIRNPAAADSVDLDAYKLEYFTP